MDNWLRGATFGVVLTIVFGAVALLQAGGPDGREERIDRLEREVRALSHRIETLEKCLAEPPRLAYAGIGKSSPLRSIQQRGARISLSNGTNWNISPRDQAMAMQWGATEQITVQVSRNPNYPYALVNNRRDQVAEAQYVGTFGG